jgi:TP901 family phage tail tape measure protein
MATVGELLILIAGNNAPLTAALAKSEAELKGFSATAGTTGAAAGIGLGAAAVAGAAVAAGIGLFGVLSSKAASEFQAAMTLVRTQAGASEEEVKSMTAAVLQLSPSVGFGPEQLANALFHVESAGLRGSAALDLLTLAAQGAKVGHADLESVTNALIATVNSGIAGTNGMSESMGVLNAIVGAGNLRMQDLTGAFTTGILSAASTFGVSIQSVGAAIADMASQGIPAEEAATRLRMTLSLIGAPKDKAIADLASIGIGATQLAEDMRSGGILQAVQDLKTHLEESGLTAVQQAALISGAFGGGRSSSAIMVLLNSVEKLGTIQTQVTEGTGAFGEAWAVTAAETETAAARFGATLNSIVVAIGTGFLPVANEILATVQPIVASIASWTATNPELAATILAVVGGVAALIPVIIAVTAIIGALSGTIGLVVIAVAAIGVAFATNFGGIRDIVEMVASAIGTVVDQFVNFVTSSGLVQGVVGAISTGLGILRGTFDAIVAVISTVVGWITTFVMHLTGARDSAGAARTIFDALGTVLGIVRDVFSAVVNVISTVVTAIATAIDRTGVLNIVFAALKAAADIINVVFGLIGDAFHRAFEVAGQVAGVVSGALATAFNVIKGVIDAVTGVVRGLIDALRTAIDLAGKAAEAVTGPGGVHLDKTPGADPVADFLRTMKLLPEFQSGGVVPGIGPQLAVVHGGETVTPAGGPAAGQAGGGPRSIVTHVHVHLDGRQIAEVIDERLFGAASVFNSGFVSNGAEP